MERLYKESELLYVKVSPPRIKILQYLNRENDFVKVTKLAEDLKMGRGKVYFHCKGLKGKEMIQLERATPRSLHAKITEKGKQVIEQINVNIKQKRGKSIE